MKRTLGLILLAVPCLAAIDGTLTDATSGKPASNTPIALVEPGQGGMKTIAKTTTGPDGAFAFTEQPKGPALLQAVFAGVTYSKMLMPGAPAVGLKMDVYQATAKPVAQVAQHMILVQPTGTNLSVNETLLLQGAPKLTYSDHENGTVRFYLPPGASGGTQVTMNAPGGMPVQRPARQTKTPNVYSVDFPIKPGETRVDFTYTVPASTPSVFEGKILHKEGKARLVVPNGVTLKGDSIQDLGKEPQTQATIYDIKGQAFKVEVSGTGLLQPPEDPAASGEDNGSPKIEQAVPHIYNRIYWILGLTLAVLGLGSYLLAKRSA